jgi:eukaryotic-like serine/threonine-protein kinase
LKPGYRIADDLVLVRRLGVGGMGTVWLAEHRRLKAEVVVKFLSESLASNADACERFSREVTATVQVRSPHVVQMLDHGITEGGVPYIVMELLEGCDLAKTMRDGQLRPDEVQHVIEGVAAALTKAHERGIVHRDIKPANVFMCTGSPRPFVKLVDFGIAKRLEDETMTAANALLGTPAYMSPEQMGGAGDVDHRADLWALGVLAYHTLTGTPPFRGAHIANIAHAILNEATPRLTAARPDLPQAVDAWMDRALARDPAARFTSAREMAETLAEALGDLAYPTPRKVNGSGAAAVMPVHAGSVPALAGTGSATARMASGMGHVAEPSPSGHVLEPASSLPAFEGEGSTFGPSAITRPPPGGAARFKWWVTGAAALAVILIGGAFRVGYGLRRDVAPLVAPAAAAMTTDPQPSTPVPALQGIVIGASPDPATSATATGVSTPAAPRPPATLSGAGRRLPPPRVPPKRGHRNDDDVGF